MIRGSSLLIDEINMAEDAVVERLNSVLEVDRTLLLSEKGSTSGRNGGTSSPKVIIAHREFSVLATMNPGGDFGKKELSPALRSRFTEMWFPQPRTFDDYSPIITRRLSSLQNGVPSSAGAVNVMSAFMKQCLSRDPQQRLSQISFVVTLRDLSIWAEFVAKCSSERLLGPLDAVVHGARLVFLDGLCVGSVNSVHTELEALLWETLLNLLPENMRLRVASFRLSGASDIYLRRDTSKSSSWFMEVAGFKLFRNPCSENHDKRSSKFSFDAPNTLRNTARIARALLVGRFPTLLEGPPGSGKTSLIEALANEAGFPFIRVNLSEATEMSDLVGSDAPGIVQGSFSFREGPLLKAIRTGAWLLLDELNLASQSVLEGLNSILDHRRSLFVPEINQEFVAMESFKLFGAQNPAVDGGGRRGLPKSFLNRFFKVWIEAPDGRDILSIVSSQHPSFPVSFSQKIVRVLEQLGERFTSSGRKPFGLRDALRWCDLLSSFERLRLDGKVGPISDTRIFEKPSLIGQTFDVVVLQSLTSDEERIVAGNIFDSEFGFEWNVESVIPLTFCAHSNIRVGMSLIDRIGTHLSWEEGSPSNVFIDRFRLREIQALSLGLKHGWSTILFSESSSLSRLEGERLFRLVAMASGKRVHVVCGGELSDFDDFIGGYHQQDSAWLLRCVLNTWRVVLRILIRHVLNCSEEDQVDSVVRCISQVEGLVSRDSGLSLEDASCNGDSDVSSFVSKSSSALEFLKQGLPYVNLIEGPIQVIDSYTSLLLPVISSNPSDTFSSFTWRKSDFLQAIEAGDWIYVQDADHCPPAILDRLNPLFERSSMKAMHGELSPPSQRMVLAEAPSSEDGSPTFLEPHHDFRVVFSLSCPGGLLGNLGLSRALIDRSLCIFLGEDKSALQRPFCENMYANFDKSRFMQTIGTLVPSSSGLVGSNGVLPVLRSSPNISEVGNIFEKSMMFCLSRDGEAALIDRDLSSLERLEQVSASSLDSVFEKLPSSLSVVPSEREYRARHMLISHGCFAFLLSASSMNNFQARMSLLKRKQDECPIIAGMDAYEDVFRVASKVPQQIQQSVPACEMSKHSFPCPIDPIFGFDSSSSHILDMCFRSDETSVCFFAKMFRLEVLIVEEVRVSFEKLRSHSTVDGNTSFSTLKRTVDLMERGVDMLAVSRRPDLLSLLLVSEVEKFLDSGTHRVCESFGWISSAEEYWVSFLRGVKDILDILSAETFKTSDFVLPLVRMYKSFTFLPSELGSKKFSDLVSPLSCLVGTVEKTLSENCILSMPFTVSGLKLEREILMIISDGPKTRFSFRQLDGAIKAVVSLRSKHVENCSDLVTSFESLLEPLRLTSSTSDDVLSDKSLGLLVRYSHMCTLNAMLASLLHLFSLKGCDKGTVTSSLRKSYKEATCIEGFMLSSSVSLQRLSWMLEKKSFDLECFKGFHCTVLAELMTICLPRQLPNAEANGTNIDVGFMKSTVEDYVIPFWNLPGASIDAFNALKLVIRGVHTVEDCGIRMRQLVVTSLVSSLVDNRVISEAEGLQEVSKTMSSAEPEVTVLSMKDRILGEPSISQRTKSLSGLSLKWINSCLKSFRSASSSASELGGHVEFGCAWIFIGLLRLHAHCVSIEELFGVDPSFVAQSCATYASNYVAQCSTALEAFTVMSDNRLGGNIAKGSLPVRQWNAHFTEYVEILSKACDRIVERPETAAMFEAYENTVKSSFVTLSRLFLEDGPLANLFDIRTYSVLEQHETDIRSLLAVTDTLSSTLEGRGTFSHFRDLSSTFQLSLREYGLGLCYILKGLDHVRLLANSSGEKSLVLVNDIYRYPRRSFSSSLSFANIIEKCIDAKTDGDCMLSIAAYYADHALREGFLSVSDFSRGLLAIAMVWKKWKISSEKDEEKKSSLHILKEVSLQNEVEGANIISRLEVDEESDFERVFNPISEEFEEAMVGIAHEHDSGSSSVEKKASSDSVSGQERSTFVSAEAFWNIHKTIFEPKRTHRMPSTDASSGLSLMDALASYLPTLNPKMNSSISSCSNIWDLVCARRCAKQFIPGKNGSASNFYTDVNVPLLSEASTALCSLHQAVMNIQRKSFKDIGDHPVLTEVTRAIGRIASSCRTLVPLSNVVIGMENVLRKVDEWHRLFSVKATRFDAETSKVSRLVAKFRTMEISSWRQLLQNRRLAFEKRASNWFLLLFDAVVNPCFHESSKTEESRKLLVSLVDQFLRSSPCGEFACRLEMVTSIAKHLRIARASDSFCCEIGNTLSGLSLFYSLYLPGLNSRIEELEGVVFSKLEEFKKLVSWTATEDLGSSVKMSKANMKNLEYFRLKAAYEKTRRRLHKLCFEMDSIYRRPVYEFIKKDIEMVGFERLSGEDVADGNDVTFGSKETFSQRIPVVCEKLSSFLHETVRISSNTESKWFSSSDSLLSRSEHFYVRMKKFGRVIRAGKKSALDLAPEFTQQIRQSLKRRVGQLRSTADASIQLKKRSLVELFRCLQTIGLPPYDIVDGKGTSSLETSFLVQAPTLCDDFDSFADDLFLICQRQVRRLREVADKRLRHPDISQDDASRCVAFCNQLLYQLCQQRASIRAIALAVSNCSASICVRKDFTKATLCDDESSSRFVSIKTIQYVQEIIRDMKCSLEDFRVLELACNTAFSSPVQSSHEVSRDICNLSQELRNLQQKENSPDELKFISKRLSLCIRTMQDELNDKSVKVVVGASLQNASLLDFELEKSVDIVTSRLSGLLGELETIYSDMSKFPDSNVFKTMLDPTISFLRNKLGSFPTTEDCQQCGASRLETYLSDAEDGVREILESMLVSTQNILQWSNIASVDIDQFEEGEEANPKAPIEIPKIFKRSHSMLSGLMSVSNLDGISTLLEKHNAVYDSLAVWRKFLTHDQKTAVGELNSLLGRLLNGYLDTIFIPALHKCVNFHCHSLSFLRTLSTFFCGLCQDGFCRPAETDEGKTDGVEKDVSGTGFGEAGDGDMSTAQNVSDQIEDEEQLLGLKDDLKDAADANNEKTEDEDGFEMTTDFEGDLQDLQSKEDEMDEMTEDSKIDAEKQMSDNNGKGKDTIDEKMWGTNDHPSGEGSEEEGASHENTVAQPDELVARDSNSKDASQKENPEKLAREGKSSNDMDIDNEGASDDSGENDSGLEKKGSEGKPLDFDEETDPAAHDENRDEAQIENSGPDNQDEQERQEQDGNESKPLGDPAESNIDNSLNEDGAEAKQTNESGNQDRDENCEAMEEVDELESGDFQSKLEGESGEDDDAMVGENAQAMENETGDDGLEENRGNEGEGGFLDEMDMGNLSDSPPSDEDLSCSDGNADDVVNGGDGNADRDDFMENDDGTDKKGEEEPLKNGVELNPGMMTSKQLESGLHDENVIAVHGVGTGNPTTNSGENGFDEDGNVRNELEDLSNPAAGQGKGNGGEQASNGAQSNFDEKEKLSHANEMQDANPLRKKADLELVKKWQEYIKEIGDSMSSAVGEKGNGQGEELEFVNEEDSVSEEEAALGGATNEQHIPLPDENEDTLKQNEGEVDEHREGRQESGKDSQANLKNEMLAPISREEELGVVGNEERSPDLGDVTTGKANTGADTRTHPARQAVEKTGSLEMKEAQLRGPEGNDPAVCEDANLTDSCPPLVNARMDWTMELLSSEEACSLWRELEAQVSREASSLCEQLRLVLEPTIANSLAGGFRTGKRLNMRKVIEYVASDFQKDKIWLRRTKADKRNYDIVIAIDDSASMAECEGGAMALRSVCTILSAMAKLEVGRVSVLSFGTETKLVRSFAEPLPISVEKGGELLQHFMFSQNETDVCNLLDFVQGKMMTDETSFAKGNENLSLLFVISDGRVNNRERIKRQVTKLREKNVLVAFVIVDGGSQENAAEGNGQSSIFDVKRVQYDSQGDVTVTPYMQDFPVAFYVVVQDLRSMPTVLADALKQWMEMATL